MKLITFTLVLLSIACSPKVYVIDRQTVLQEQAAGEWPEFDKSLLPQMKKKDPINFSTGSNSENEKTKRLYRVLNSELASPQGEKL